MCLVIYSKVNKKARDAIKVTHGILDSGNEAYKIGKRQTETWKDVSDPTNAENEMVKTYDLYNYKRGGSIT